MITSIYIKSPNDAGCEISKEEHERYAELVAEAVTEAYGVPCEVELCDCNTTTVHVYGRSEPGTSNSVRNLAQDVWEQGNFWE